MAKEVSIAFLGLGAMGCGMAVNLVQRGFKVTGYDVNEYATQQLVSAGGYRATGPRAAVEEGLANVLICMVATEQQASSCLFDVDNGAVASLPVNATILLCLTASPEFARKVRSSLDNMNRQDIILLDCPVSGGADRAAEGTLSILYSGTAHLSQIGKDLLEALGSRLYPAGSQVGNAFGLKMVHQILVGVHIVAAVESIALATVSGLEIQALYEDIMSSDGASWLFGQRVPHMMASDEPPFSSLGIILKDLNAVNAYGQARRFPLLLSSTAAQIFSSVINAGYGSEDDCTTLRLYLPGRLDAVVEHRIQVRSEYPPTLGSALAITTSTVKDILRGIHLAAAAEAMSFARELDLDLRVFRDFVKDAAGASVMFQNYSSQTLQTISSTTSKLIDGNEDILSKLESAFQHATAVHYPLPLCAAALQSFYVDAQRLRPVAQSQDENVL